MKCKETKRELDKWVMELAHYLEAEYELEWKVALRKAHLTKTILGLMGTSVVQFTYRKKDGTLREARGTLCRQMSAAFAAYGGRGGLAVRHVYVLGHGPRGVPDVLGRPIDRSEK